MPLLRVAIAGATGNVGRPIFDALVAASYPVTVLTRKGNKTTADLPSTPNVTIKEVDYTSVPELTAALQGNDAVISTLAGVFLGSQSPLIDASVAAGVQRFFPSEFGSDTQNPKTAALPVMKAKVETEAYLKAKAAANPKFSYTALITGPLFDWGLDHAFFLNPREHKATLYNGGDARFSVSRLSTVAQGVVGALEHLPETANRAVYVQDAVVTQNQLIAYIKEKDGKEWDAPVKSTDDSYRESMAELSKGPDANHAAVFVGLLMSALFDPSYGSDFSGRTDNELLGIKGMTDAEVKEFVQQYAS